MRDLKQTGFTDRIAAQQARKKALLEGFKPKPAQPDPEFDKLAAKRPQGAQGPDQGRAESGPRRPLRPSQGRTLNDPIWPERIRHIICGG